MRRVKGRHPRSRRACANSNNQCQAIARAGGERRVMAESRRSLRHMRDVAGNCRGTLSLVIWPNALHQVVDTGPPPPPLIAPHVVGAVATTVVDMATAAAIALATARHRAAAMEAARAGRAVAQDRDGLDPGQACLTRRRRCSPSLRFAKLLKRERRHDLTFGTASCATHGKTVKRWPHSFTIFWKLRG
jgi:hypothetical protein